MGDDRTARVHEDDDATRAETPESRLANASDGPSIKPLPSSPPTGTLAHTTTGSLSTAATPLETLRVDEIARTRVFLRYAFIVATVIGGLLAVGGGDPIAKRALYGGIVLVWISTGWFLWHLRTDAGFTTRRALITAAGCIAGAFCGIWFFGIFSPAVIVLPFGLYNFSAGQSRRAIYGVFATCALLYLALWAALSNGVLAERGVVRGDALTPRDRVVVIALVEVTLVATFLTARRNRRATLRAIELHDRAVRGIAQREALLEEARLELQQALRAGGLGRFTDAQIGSFRLGKLIGRGAMGEVYEAIKIGTNDPAAVKLLQAHVLADADLVRRFLREAKIAASLAVPNVVRVLEIGGPEVPFPYIAMERLRGEDLSEQLRAHRRLSVARTIALIQEVGRGLDAARAAGIVHRDLKPRNLFHAEVEGSTARVWKILDFGVSKLMDGEGTQTKDQIVGTPSYMAPEQASGGAVSYRTDLYALGVIAYRVLTGRPAFTGDHTAEILYQVVYQMPPLPSGLIKLAPEVDLVLAVAMAKKDTERFESAASFADALDAAARGIIDPELRARAERLVAKQPWGNAVLRPPASSSP